MLKMQIPIIHKPIFTDEARYVFLSGGRSSSKSWTVAQKIVYETLLNPNLNIVCLREIQLSIKHSSKKLIEDVIDMFGVADLYEITQQEIKMKQGKGIFIFKGLQSHTADSIKSLESFNIAWCEESNTLSERSLELLIPTIRAEGSKLYFTYNPHTPDDPIEKLKNSVSNKIDIHNTYLDNPFCPQVIIEEAEEMKRKRPLKYNHIYLGQYGQAEGLIFENIIVRTIREAEVQGLECLQGLDFGYTNDPTAFSINYINEKEKILYIYDGFYKKNLLNSQIAKEIKLLQAHIHTIYADSAEPKSIHSLKTEYGIKRIRGAMKGKDSINAGIDFLLDYTIVINAHLTDFIEEGKKYSWAIDKQTNKPTNKPIDDYNHFWDSCFSGDTKVIVNNKKMRFDEIPKQGVITGFNGKNVRYSIGGFVKKDDIYKITLADGSIIKATLDHEFLTLNGWIKTKNLKGEFICKSSLFQVQNKSLMERFIHFIKMKSIFQEEQKGFIGLFGNIIMEKYKKAYIFIILMKIKQTITLKILKLKSVESIYPSILNNIIKITQWLPSIKLIKIKTNAGRGTKAKKVKSGIKRIMKKCKTLCIKKLLRDASNVIKNLQIFRIHCFAQANVRVNGEESQASTMSKEDVLCAIKSLQLTNTTKQRIAVESVELYLEQAKTYCVSVPTNECFSLADGHIVSNCRYAISAKIQRKTKPKSKRMRGI